MEKKQQYEVPVLEELKLEEFVIVQGESPVDYVTDPNKDPGDPTL